METAEYAVEVSGITKSFPGVKALSDVCFKVKRGHVHAIVGENGAGKSTLIKILSGSYKPDSGEVLIGGEKAVFESPHDAIAAGINVVHQELRLVETLSVAENIFLGKPPMKDMGFVCWHSMIKQAQNLLDQLDFTLNVYETVNRLSVAQKQIVEICKAISNKCKIIIMDEPSATLTEKELNILFHAIRKLREDGVTIIYISHRLNEIFEIADEVTVLRDGEHIHSCPVGDIDKKQLITMMVGRELAEEYPKEEIEIGDKVMEVKNLSRAGVLHDISFTLHKGEILGIAGLVGAGRTELARAILGLDPIDKGQVLIKGKDAGIRRFRHAISKRMALVPEDRRGQGLILDMKVKENITLVGINKVCKYLKINNRIENDAAETYVRTLGIVPSDINHIVKHLSGGNQQKIVLSKWLFVEPEIIILDEPTRGVDVGAKAEMYKFINTMTKNGLAVIMISSEIPEIIGMADRVLVMHGGMIKGELMRSELSPERILNYCVM